MNTLPKIGGRYSDGYGNGRAKLLKVAGSCCTGKPCNRYGNCGCGCGNSQPRYASSTPGAASGQSATMMMPNIVINVQSGNRRSADYTDAHNASTSYSPSEANPLYYAPTNTENNPFTSSYERGDIYSSRYGAVDRAGNEVERDNADVVPIILSPKAAAKASQSFNPGPRPGYVGRVYPPEFP